MSVPLRAKLFYFNKGYDKHPVWPAKNPSHIRTRTQISLAKFKFRVDCDSLVSNNSKRPAQPSKTYGLAVSEEKKQNKVPVCEIQELKAFKKEKKIEKFSFKSLKKNYFNTNSFNNSISSIKNTTMYNIDKKQYKSVRLVANEIWGRVKENFTAKDWRPSKSKKMIKGSYFNQEDDKTIKNHKNGKSIDQEANSNCVCVQTDDTDLIN